MCKQDQLDATKCVACSGLQLTVKHLLVKYRQIETVRYENNFPEFLHQSQRQDENTNKKVIK